MLGASFLDVNGSLIPDSSSPFGGTKQVQALPCGIFPDSSFAREPSNSTGGTFTHEALGFPGARQKTSWSQRGSKFQKTS